MSGLLERFLVSLSLAILDKLVAKGTAEYEKYLEFQAALVAAGKYQAVVDKPGGITVPLLYHHFLIELKILLNIIYPLKFESLSQ